MARPTLQKMVGLAKDTGGAPPRRLPPPTQVRTHLKLDAYALSEETMRSVWVALDSDGSGYLSAGEFGRFMRKGEEGVGSVSTTWRQNLHAKLQREREELYGFNTSSLQSKFAITA